MGGSMQNPATLAQGFATYAEWVGLTHIDRAPLWVQRLQMNADEIGRFQAVATPKEAPYAACPIAVEPPPASWMQAELPITYQRGTSIAAQALDRAHGLHKLNAITDLAPQIAQGEPGYLSGTPLVVKNMIGVQGMPRTAGSASSDTQPFIRDSAAVAALKRQGAVVIGLANLHELAFGPSSNNPVHGQVVNPASPERIPGGSSGGSAAAVAAGIVDVALGTDTGGSIRIPAACCGVVGFKPSYDAVSRDGVIEVSASLDHVGPIGRSVTDCANAFAALTSLEMPPQLPDRPIQGLRIGQLGGFFADPISEDVRGALQRAAGLLQRDGAKLMDIDGIEDMALAPAIQFMTISAEAATALHERLHTAGERLGDDVRVRLEMASLLPAHWYIKAQKLRRQLVNRMNAWFDDCDILLCPVMRSTAPLLGENSVRIGTRDYPLHTAVSNLTLPFSLSGMPAIALPLGVSSDGAPLSVQLVGAPGQDWALLQVARRLEILHGTT
jgi:aspartyl-tRNA(Asn)/glutamyl-tRNA(Gln) amidotransferase subunit A